MRFRRMKMNAGRSSQMAGRKKIHGLRSFRRGFHVGSPLERFHHSLAEYNGFFFTSYEPRTRATAFSPGALQKRQQFIQLGDNAFLFSKRREWENHFP